MNDGPITRRWLLGCAAVAMLLVSACLLVFPMLAQRHAVSRIYAAGGSVAYEREHAYSVAVIERGEPVLWDPPPHGLSERILGPDVTHVSSVVLSRYTKSMKTLIDNRIDDDFLQNIASLRAVRELSLRFQPITDAGLLSLNGLTLLEVIDLYGTHITDDSVPTLLMMPALRSVRVGDTRMTAAGIKQLVALRSLELLYLSKSQLDELGGWDAAHALFAPRDVGIAVENATPEGGGSLQSQ